MLQIRTHGFKQSDRCCDGFLLFTSESVPPSFEFIGKFNVPSRTKIMPWMECLNKSMNCHRLGRSAATTMASVNWPAAPRRWKRTSWVILLLVAFAVVKVARPDAAVFVGVAAPAVAVEVVPAVVCSCDGLVWMVWDGDCRYGFNSCLRTIYLG